jgi:hypothetical protein
MNPEGARLGQNTRSKGAVLLDGAFARRDQSPLAHVWHRISFYCVCICGWGYERSTASERKAGQGRLARIHGLMCLVSPQDILDAFDREVYRPESRLKWNGYILSLTTKMFYSLKTRHISGVWAQFHLTTAPTARSWFCTNITMILFIHTQQ